MDEKSTETVQQVLPAFDLVYELAGMLAGLNRVVCLRDAEIERLRAESAGLRDNVDSPRAFYDFVDAVCREIGWATRFGRQSTDLSARLEVVRQALSARLTGLGYDVNLARQERSLACQERDDARRSREALLRALGFGGDRIDEDIEGTLTNLKRDSDALRAIAVALGLPVKDRQRLLEMVQALVADHNERSARGRKRRLKGHVAAVTQAWREKKVRVPT